ncbi:MAG: branched-chain amino acid ABC transporter permease, partial [Candidatus Bathyarchaeota archaeon]|nr:branched-chain amino acid ABC transporter permease [Candidatus Bathyarchaeota archaeon]
MTLFQQIVNGLILGSSYALIASGLTIMFSVMKIINLAHGELYMLGAYFTFYVSSVIGVNYLLSLIISILAIIILAIPLEKGVFRPTRGNMSATLLVSLGLSIVLQNVSLAIWGPGPKGIPTPYSHVIINVQGVLLTLQRLFIFIVSWVLMLAMHLFIQRTKIGKAIRATAQNREAATILGIRFDLIYTITFALGCSLCAIAGALMG